MKKKTLLKLSLALSSLPLTAIAVVSCSQNSSNNWASQVSTTYSNIWNLTNTNITNNQNNNSVYSLTIQQLEDQINNVVNSNKFLLKQAKAWCFSMLWNAIKSPYSRSGSVITSLPEDLSSYSSFLSGFVAPDETDGDTYNKLNSFVDSFYDIKINLLSFSGDTPSTVKIDKNLTVGQIINDPQSLNLLNFQIDFKINNEDANTKIIDTTNNRSIFSRTSVSSNREEVQLIQQYKNAQDNIGNLITNQFNYQGAKMYYDVATKTFKTIVLPSNIRYKGQVSTKPSGFVETYDTERTEFYFDYKQISSTKWGTYLIIDLSNQNYFGTSNIGSAWVNYLTQQGIYVDSSAKKIEINLNKTITYDASEYES